MITSPIKDFALPQSTLSIWQSEVGSIETLPYWDLCVQASRNVRELLDLLDQNPQAPGVLVLEEKRLVGLIPRERVYEKLGRPFGVELYLKMSNKQFYSMLGISTLVLNSETLIDDAVKLALERDIHSLYEPIAVAHPSGNRIISMYSILTAQQDMLQNLYSEVRYLSTIDPLTLVKNRRGFFEAVNQQLITIRHFDLEYAVMMVDIDDFKKVNDRYGHLVGDEMLKSLAQHIRQGIREKDILGRFGGDEFIIFLMDIPEQAAVAKAEKLLQDIASMFHAINGFQIRVTISIGVSCSRGANSILDRLLSEADQAVYAAKEQGRNNVVSWQKDLGRTTKHTIKFRSDGGETAAQLEHLPEQTLQGLLHILSLRDYETETHTMRVSNMALQFAQKVRIPEKQLEGVRVGSLLHDIGKIAIPDKILFKKGKLTEAEWEIMKKHPEYAQDLLAPISFFQNAIEIPYCHHEHWDGKGYPRGLREEEIPLSARVFTIVDVWDALSSDRPYRPAWDENRVRDFLASEAGRLFDPALAPLFLENLDEFLYRPLSGG